MEIMLRCSLPDRPGALGELTGAVGRFGGDIQAVEVVETADGRALDDLVVVVPPDGLNRLVEGIEGLDGVKLVHMGPSRGHPGDAVTRLALGFQSLLDGAMTVEHGVATLVGGLLRADAVELVPAAEAPRGDALTLVLPFDDLVLVVRREYRFTDTERARTQALLRASLEAARFRRATGAAEAAAG